MVEVDVERPVTGEQLARALQARAQEAEVVGVAVVVGERAAALGAAGVERRVDVDQVEGAVGQPPEDLGVVGLDDEVVAGELDAVGELAGEDAHYSSARTFSATCSGVIPSFSSTSGPGAEAPKRSIATESSTHFDHPIEMAASTETLGTPAGRTDSR